MVLKGYRSWVMGQLDSTCRALPRGERVRRLDMVVERAAGPRAVVAHVAFERQTLKPDFQMIGYRLWV
jgi:hypothetical protein